VHSQQVSVIPESCAKSGLLIVLLWSFSTDPCLFFSSYFKFKFYDCNLCTFIKYNAIL